MTGKKEASEHESKSKYVHDSKLPRDGDGLPIFDLVLVGVGDNRHVESPCLNRGEIDRINGP